MQDVVKQAIEALEKRHLDPYVKHPDNEGAFLLCKQLKKHGLNVSDSVHHIKEFYQESEARQILMARDGERIEEFTFQIQCFDVWDKVDNSLEILQTAIRKAHFTDTPEKASKIPDKDAMFLARVCRELQSVQGDKPFFISQKDAGLAIGKGRVAGAARLKALIMYKVIKQVSAGHSNKANEYTFLY